MREILNRLFENTFNLRNLTLTSFTLNISWQNKNIVSAFSGAHIQKQVIVSVYGPNIETE